jgi:hypothetical protein
MTSRASRAVIGDNGVSLVTANKRHMVSPCNVMKMQVEKITFEFKSSILKVKITKLFL